MPGALKRGKPKPSGGGAQSAVGFTNDYRVGKAGQLSVGTKDGGRFWLGQAEGKYGSLVPTGMGDNGYMQHGYVPIGNYTNADPNSPGTPFAREGGERAGFADDFGWNPVGKANTKAWKGMAGTGAYETYGQPTGVFKDVGIQAFGSTPKLPFAAKAATGGRPTQGGSFNPKPFENAPGVPEPTLHGGPKTGPHMEFGQQGKGTGQRQNPRGNNSQGGLPGQKPGGGKPGGAEPVGDEGGGRVRCHPPFGLRHRARHAVAGGCRRVPASTGIRHVAPRLPDSSEQVVHPTRRGRDRGGIHAKATVCTLDLGILMMGRELSPSNRFWFRASRR